MDLKRIDLTSLFKYIHHELPEHFVNDPGREAYAYYAALGSDLHNGALVSDLGTLHGLSALAFSYNENIQVESYDINLFQKYVGDRDNIKFIQDNMFNQLDRILESDLILVDVDPHDGEQERQFLDELAKRRYKGTTLWDDIHLNPQMQAFWNSIEMEKTDVTHLGHYTGTGLIVFE